MIGLDLSEQFLNLRAISRNVFEHSNRFCAGGISFFTMKVPDSSQEFAHASMAHSWISHVSCESAIGARQLNFMYGDVADRRHVRLGGNIWSIRH